MVLFYANFPAGREFRPRQSVPSDTPAPDANGPPPSGGDGGAGGVPSSTNNPTPTDHFVPSFNNPQPWVVSSSGTGVSPTPPSTIISSANLPASSSVTLSTNTLQSTPTDISLQGGAVSTSSSSNRKYIIGGAVGGGVLALILLVLLLFCCKRRGKKDLERGAGGNSEEEHGYGQFACCNHGNCNKNGGAAQMEQKTPLKPFALRSDPAASNPRDLPQFKVSLNRRASAESQKSVGSDTYSESTYSTDSEGSGKRRSQKRPPPLKLTSLVTPVVNGPQNNPRRVDRSSIPRLPAIVVDPPPSAIPERMRRH